MCQYRYAKDGSQVFFSATSFTAQMPELSYNCLFDLTDEELRSVKQTRCKLSPTEEEYGTPRRNRKGGGAK